jgi:hypothetical protein
MVPMAAAMEWFPVVRSAEWREKSLKVSRFEARHPRGTFRLESDSMEMDGMIGDEMVGHFEKRRQKHDPLGGCRLYFQTSE